MEASRKTLTRLGTKDGKYSVIFSSIFSAKISIVKRHFSKEGVRIAKIFDHVGNNYLIIGKNFRL